MNSVLNSVCRSVKGQGVSAYSRITLTMGSKCRIKFCQIGNLFAFIGCISSQYRAVIGISKWKAIC